VDLQVIGFERIERDGEARLKVMGFIDGQFYVLILVFRPNSMRAISLRRGRLEELKEDE